MLTGRGARVEWEKVPGFKMGRVLDAILKRALGLKIKSGVGTRILSRGWMLIKLSGK